MLPLMGTDSATADIKDAGALASSVSPLAIAVRPAVNSPISVSFGLGSLFLFRWKY